MQPTLSDYADQIENVIDLLDEVAKVVTEQHLRHKVRTPHAEVLLLRELIKDIRALDETDQENAQWQETEAETLKTQQDNIRYYRDELSPTV